MSMRILRCLVFLAPNGAFQAARGWVGLRLKLGLAASKEPLGAKNTIEPWSARARDVGSEPLAEPAYVTPETTSNRKI